jgi:hypothetical protein
MLSGTKASTSGASIQAVETWMVDDDDQDQLAADVWTAMAGSRKCELAPLSPTTSRPRCWPAARSGPAGGLGGCVPSPDENTPAGSDQSDRWYSYEPSQLIA